MGKRLKASKADSRRRFWTARLEWLKQQRIIEPRRHTGIDWQTLIDEAQTALNSLEEKE